MDVQCVSLHGAAWVRSGSNVLGILTHDLLEHLDASRGPSEAGRGKVVAARHISILQRRELRLDDGDRVHMCKR